MGRIYFHLGDHNKAKNYLEKAVKINDGNIDYHFWLADVYAGKKSRANFLSVGKWAGKWKKEFETAFETDPMNIEARKRLIYYYLNETLLELTPAHIRAKDAKKRLKS